MKRLMIWCVALAAASAANAQSVKRWDFDKSGDQEGWTVPARERGVVMGGSLWVTVSPTENDPRAMSTWWYQAFGAKDFQSSLPVPYLAFSPTGLNALIRPGTQIRLRVLNLSSITDIYVAWRTTEQTWPDAMSQDEYSRNPQARRCTMKADLKEWQEIVCDFDPAWTGAIDQFALVNPIRGSRGDLWIDWIELGQGAPKPEMPRPEMSSARVVPRISIPGISQEGFSNAFAVLDRAVRTDVPLYGFNYPFISAGGYYHWAGWILLDSSLALTGAKWASQPLAEGVMRGFGELQAANPDGRIDMVALNAVRGQVGDLSAMPRIFDVAYDVARRTNDPALRLQIYEMMRKYLDWWLSPVKRETRTQLVAAILYDETFGDRAQSKLLSNDRSEAQVAELLDPMRVAPTDLNVAVAVGAIRTAVLAERLGKTEEAARYRQSFEALARAINSYLWDEKQGAYLNYDLRDGHRREGLNASTFDALRMRIAPEDRRRRLLKRMTDPAQFNWGVRALTTYAKTDPIYVEAEGPYDGRAWFGNVWTMRNMPIIDGLEESGRYDLAAELNWQTIKLFHDNYHEFVGVASGNGGGCPDYSATASQYIGAVVEHLFGVDYDAIEKRLTISPHIPKELYGKDLKIERLILPTTKGDTRLSLSLIQSGPGKGRIEMAISGPLPEGTLELSFPGGRKTVSVPMQAQWSGELQ